MAKPNTCAYVYNKNQGLLLIFLNYFLIVQIIGTRTNDLWSACNMPALYQQNYLTPLLL